MKLPIIRAAEVLLGGGIIAYPTEGVFGLGCMPDDAQALQRLLDIKQRDPAKGLILIAAEASQFDGWVASSDLARLPQPDPDRPVTWIARPGPNVGPLVRGDNDGVAVRLTSNPVAAAICDEIGAPITSTSANLAGQAVVRNSILLPHGSRSSLFVTQETGLTMKKVWIMLINTGMFGPIKVSNQY